MIDKLNTNIYFIGLSMIILTIGGRFIISELSEEQKERINTKYYRRLFIFCAFFMATRDIITAIILTTIAIIIISNFINGNNTEKKREIDYIDDNEVGYSSDNLGFII